MEKKETIIFFLKEYRFSQQYFGNLLDKLKEFYNVIILHTSSLEKSKVASDAKYENFDISDWSSLKLKKFFLNRGKVQVFITNIRSLLDINIITLCNNIKVSIIYIEHGLTLKKITQFKKSNKLHTIKKYFYYIYNSVLNVFIFPNKIETIKNTYLAFFKSNYKNLLLDKALFYSKKSYEILNIHFDLTRSKVLYSGYPIVELNKDFVKFDDIKLKKQVLLIHQPLIHDNFSTLTISEEIELYNQINEVCMKLGYSFILKLHPRTDVEKYSEIFNGIIASNQMKIEELIAESFIVVGYFSTALLTVLKLKKILLIFNQENIVTEEINVFRSDNNCFNSVTQFEDLFTDLIENKIRINQIDLNVISGKINTHEDRFNKTLTLLKF